MVCTVLYVHDYFEYHDVVDGGDYDDDVLDDDGDEDDDIDDYDDGDGGLWKADDG